MKDRSNYKVTRNNYQRAVSSPIRTGIHYRPEGKEDWQLGETKNLSPSGMLFNASELLAVNTALDLAFPLPTEIGSEAGPIILCRGRVVRTILPPASDQLGSMVADFSVYRLPRASGEKIPEDA